MVKIKFMCNKEDKKVSQVRLKKYMQHKLALHIFNG